MKEQDIQWFLHHRDEWSEGIPEQILNGSLPDDEKRYKCRKTWFHAIRHMIDYILVSEGVSEIPEIIQKYEDHITSPEFRTKERTTAEDIQLGNQVINYVLEHY